MFQPRPLKRSEGNNSNGYTISTMAELMYELLQSGVKFHQFHLRVVGVGSFAEHNAVNDFYKEIPTTIDGIIESYQGVTEALLIMPEESKFKSPTTKEEAIGYARTLHSSITSLQKECPYSEIVNELDEVKSMLNSVKYFLLFLQ